MRKLLGTRVLEWWLQDNDGDTVRLARRLHIDKSTLSRQLNGERGVGDDLLVAIVAHLPEYTRRPGAFYCIARDSPEADHVETTPKGEIATCEGSPDHSRPSTTEAST